MNAWSAPNFILLTSDKTPLECGPISISEASLVVALAYMGCLMGTIIASLSTERFGRKNILMLLPIPQIVSKYSLCSLFYCDFAAFS